jgi:5-methylthioadenosine/S-adenosylhomocysteine deaminase
VNRHQQYYDLAILGGECLTLDSRFTEFRDSVILINNGRIDYIGEKKDFIGPYKAKKTIHARGKLIMPAFFNAHTHLSLSMYRGLGTDLHLHDWLSKVIWPLEKQFCNPDNVYLGSCLSLLEMIKSGTATLADMNFFSGHAAKAIDESGLRGFIGEALFSTSTPSIRDPLDGFNVASALNEKYAGHPMIHPYLVLHAPFTCSAELYRQAGLLGKKWGVKVCSHVSETRSEVDQIRSRYGKTPVAWLEETGVLDSDFIAIHMVHATDEDIDILAKCNAGVIHNPHSNMLLGSGISPVNKMIDKGIRVGLGTDSASSNNSLSILSELQTAARLHKVAAMDPSVLSARHALQMATSINADIFGLTGTTGTLAEGYSADLLIINTNAANMLPVYDHYAQIVYSMENRNIESLVVNGSVVMEDRKILTLDEAVILREVEKWTKSVSVYDFIRI